MVEPAPASLPKLTLAECTLDLRSRELRRRDDGSLVPLRRQALDVLLVLAERAGHVVDKQSLMSRVWRDVVVGDDSLAQAIVEIRRTLGDETHVVVRTVARRGYLLAAQAQPEPKATPPEVPPMAIVILPIGCDDAARDDDRRCAAVLTAELTARVGRGHPGLRVIAEATARSVDATADPRDAASRLGVHHVVSGRLRVDRGARRVALAMVDGASGAQRWAYAFEVEPRVDSAKLGDVAARAARALLVEMHHAAGERALAKPDALRSAEDLALLGWSQVYRGISPPNLERALGWFRRALEREATNCRGLGGLACVGAWTLGFGWSDDEEALLCEMRTAATLLASAHPDDTLSRLGRASVYGARGDHASQLVIAEQMIERDPGNPTAHMLRARALLRAGRFEESLAATQRTFDLSVDDFRAPQWEGTRALSLWLMGSYREAAAAARRSIAANACLPLPPLLLAAALADAGDDAEARAALRAHLDVATRLDAAMLRRLLGIGAPRYADGAQSLVRRLQQIGLR